MSRRMPEYSVDPAKMHQLREMFPEHAEHQLITKLSEANGDVEVAIIMLLDTEPQRASMPQPVPDRMTAPPMPQAQPNVYQPPMPNNNPYDVPANSEMYPSDFMKWPGNASVDRPAPINDSIPMVQPSVGVKTQDTMYPSLNAANPPPYQPGMYAPPMAPPPYNQQQSTSSIYAPMGAAPQMYNPPMAQPPVYGSAAGQPPVYAPPMGAYPPMGGYQQQQYGNNQYGQAPPIPGSQNQRSSGFSSYGTNNGYSQFQ